MIRAGWGVFHLKKAGVGESSYPWLHYHLDHRNSCWLKTKILKSIQVTLHKAGVQHRKCSRNFCSKHDISPWPLTYLACNLHGKTQKQHDGVTHDPQAFNEGEMIKLLYSLTVNIDNMEIMLIPHTYKVFVLSLLLSTFNVIKYATNCFNGCADGLRPYISNICVAIFFE